MPPSIPPAPPSPCTNTGDVRRNDGPTEIRSPDAAVLRRDQDVPQEEQKEKAPGVRSFGALKQGQTGGETMKIGC